MKQTLLVFALVLAGLVVNAQNSSRPELTVYPNPTLDYFSVNDNSEQVSRILVFSLSGKQVKSFDCVKGEQYYVADLPKGFYLAQLMDHNQKVLTTQKLNKR